MRALINGAREFPTTSEINRKFIKHGYRADAISDFNSLKTEIKSRQPFGSIGLKGKTKVMLTLNSRDPLIQIWDPSLNKSIKIYYKKPRF